MLLFGEIIRFRGRDTDFSDTLLDEKLYKEKYENILIHDTSYKTSMGAKPLCIMFDEIDRFIEIHDKGRYLVSFDYCYCDKICDNIKSLMNEKMVLQIALIIIFQEWELIHMILELLKKYWLLIML